MTPADQIYSLPTNTGAAKLSYALANKLTVDISHMAIGDGNGAPVNPTAAATKLTREVHRAQLNQLYQHPDNPNWLVAELVIPAEVGGWTIREIGLYDVAGDLIFIGNHAEQYKPVQNQGSDETKTIRMVILVSSVASVTLRTDPTTVMATIKFVNDSVAAAATEATQAEAEAGTDGTRKMTPRRVWQAITRRFSTQPQAEEGVDDSTAMTPLRVWQAIKKRYATAAQAIDRANNEVALTPYGLDQALRSGNFLATDTRSGAVRIASQAEVNAGTGVDTVVAPQRLRMGFAVSLSHNGYVVFPTWMGGLIIQWMHASAGGSGTLNGNVNSWPLAFPNALFVAVLAHEGAAAGTYVVYNDGEGAIDKKAQIYVRAPGYSEAIAARVIGIGR